MNWFYLNQFAGLLRVGPLWFCCSCQKRMFDLVFSITSFVTIYLLLVVLQHKRAKKIPKF